MLVLARIFAVFVAKLHECDGFSMYKAMCNNRSSTTTIHITTTYKGRLGTNEDEELY
jgi:hypothetical protein